MHLQNQWISKTQWFPRTRENNSPNVPSLDGSTGTGCWLSEQERGPGFKHNTHRSKEDKPTGEKMRSRREGTTIKGALLTDILGQKGGENLAGAEPHLGGHVLGGHVLGGHGRNAGRETSTFMEGAKGIVLAKWNPASHQCGCFMGSSFGRECPSLCPPTAPLCTHTQKV